jgi:hypothetical protein
MDNDSMWRILRRLTPRLSRRAWLVLAGQWLAIFAILWFAIPITPSVTLHSDHPRSAPRLR